MVKNSSANAVDTGDAVLIPGSGRYPVVVSSTLAWEIPWTEEPGWAAVQRGCKELDMTGQACMPHGAWREGRKGEIQEFFFKAPSRDSHNPAVRVKNECFRFSHKHLV